MICRNCGNNIGDRVVCPYCGMQNQQAQLIDPKPPKKVANKGPIIIMIIMVIMAIAVFVFVNTNRIKVEEVDDSSSNSNVATNSNSTMNSNSASNIVSSNSNSNSTEIPEHLVCIQELNDIYGNHKNTFEYTFERNKVISYKKIVEATLVPKYINYRDELLQQYEDADIPYQTVSGITIKSQRKSDGFIYTIEILDTSEVDSEKLKSMNLYSIDYFEIKKNADENGLTCQ